MPLVFGDDLFNTFGNIVYILLNKIVLLFFNVFLKIYCHPLFCSYIVKKSILKKKLFHYL